MFNTKDFKKSVLDRAMRGKLTKQLPEDGDAKDLLNQIDTEKKSLINDGKIKAQKPLPEITEDEIPFEIPDNWQWVRLNDISLIRSGKRIPKGMELSAELKNGYVPYLRVRDMKKNSIDENNIKYADENIVEKINKYRIYQSDIYITVAGTIGKVGTIPKTINGALLTENADRITPIAINKEFLMYEMLSVLIKYQINKFVNKVAQPKLSIKSIKQLVLAMPPISEQKRIVESIGKCFDLANHIDQEDSLTDKFNVDMRKSLLQSAMMGKLTKQLPEDGDASELLDQIKVEKEALIKAKKIKKQKPLPEIDADEIPFEIPDNWRWVRLGEISNIIMGQSPKSKDVSEGLPDNSHFEFHQGKSFFSEKTIGISDKVTTSQLRLINKDYILMSVRAPVGDVNITNRIIALGRGLCGIKPISVNKYYLYYYLMTQKNYLMRKSTGSTFKAINKKTIFEELVPLPPLSEQKRIVEKIDRLFEELKG